MEHSVICRKKAQFLIISLLLFAAPAAAQDRFVFEQLSTEEGLSQNSVTTTIIDRYGLFWFGTGSGLNMYDGYAFTTFYHEENNPASLADNYIHCLLEDSHGNIWVGTNNGLSCLDRAQRTFTNYKYDHSNPDSLLGQYVLSIREDEAGYIWVGTEVGITRVNPLTGELARYRINEQELPDQNDWITFLHFDEQGLLAQKRGGSFYRLQPGSDTLEEVSGWLAPVENMSVHAMWTDSRGNKWISLRYYGLLRIDPAGGTTFFRDKGVPKNRRIQHAYVTGLAEDDYGRIWIGNMGGLTIFNPDTDAVQWVNASPSDPNSLSINLIKEIIRDHSGNMWITTNGLGINIWKPLKDKFPTISNVPTDPTSLQYDYVYAIHRDSTETLWVGSYHGGVSRLDPATGGFINYPVRSDYLSTAARTVYDILETPDGRLLIGTDHGELFEYDRLNDRMNLRIKTDQIRKMVYLPDGRLVVAHMFHGVSVFSTAFTELERWEGKFDPDMPIASRQTRDIDLLSDGSLLLCTPEGITLTDPDLSQTQTWRHEPGNPESLSNTFCLTALQDSKGRIWIGTRGGLHLFDRDTGRFRRIKPEKGLPDNVIYCIQEDSFGMLWLGTNRGLLQYNPETDVFQFYTAHDGLQSNEYNSNASFADAEGRLYFGGVEGIDIFKPDAIVKNLHIPPVVMTEISAMGEKLELDQPIEKVRNLDLEHNQSFLTLEFSALDYVDPDNNSYAYRLQPINQEWIDLQNRRTLDLNLNPGTYRLSIIGSNNDGVWNREGLQLDITIREPYWATWWFRGLVLLIVCSIIGSYVAQRIRDGRRMQQQLKREIADKTEALRQRNSKLAEQTRELEELAREMEAFNYSVSHDLRSPLNRIRQYAEIIIQENGDRLDKMPCRFLNKIDTDAGDMMKLIDSLLRLSRAGRQELIVDTVDLSQMSRELLQELGSNGSSRHVATTVEETMTCSADPGMMRVVMENLLNNAWKFTGERNLAEIDVYMELQGGQQVYVVQDNGAGFDQSAAEKLFRPFSRLVDNTRFSGHGIGLYTVRRIIERHGGRIWAKGQPEKGAQFFFTLENSDRSET